MAAKLVTLGRLLKLMKLERIENNLYRGKSYDPGWGRVFGGQVLGQALCAAQNTVEDPLRSIHSFHSYFLRPGDPAADIVYDVDNIRDGRSISTRRVTAIQHGEKIFHLTTSFDSYQGGLDHSSPMPDVPGPDNLLSEEEYALKYADKIPKILRERFTSKQPIECRHVEFIDPLDPKVTEPRRYIWLRASDPLPQDVRIHQSLLGFCSDFNFLSTALLPHGTSMWKGNVSIATIDHSMWFHRPFQMDSWLLYSIESPSAYNGRGLVRGQVFDQNGALVASSAQEGIMRLRTQTQ